MGDNRIARRSPEVMKRVQIIGRLQTAKSK